MGLYHGIGGVTQDGFPWFTIEEVERLIEQDLADLKDVPAVEVRTEYSQNLVALPDSMPGAEVQPTADESEPEKARLLRGNSHLLIQTDPQQPVRLSFVASRGSVTATLLPHAPDAAADEGAPAPVDQQEVDLSQGDPPTVTLTPKQAGIYRIRFNKRIRYRIESSQRWAINLARDARPATWLMAQDHPWYFYVPKNVTFFELYGRGTNDKPLHIRVFDADGEMVEDQTAQQKVKVQIHVPASQQGSVWRFHMNYYLHVSTNWLHGVPPYISPSPDRLLVPREVLSE